MKTYCKNCRCEHAAWNRMNDSLICGLCGMRERTPNVRPFHMMNRPAQSPPLRRRRKT